MRSRLALLALLAAVSCAPARPLQTDICFLVEHGREMNGRLVRFTAINKTDHMHASFFVDPSCWDAGVVDFYEDAGFRGSETARAFEDTSLRQHQADLRDAPLESGKDLRLDVTGVFQWIADPAVGIDFRDSRARIRVRQVHSFEAVDHVFRNELERQRDRCQLRAILNRELEIAREACDVAKQLSNGADWDLYHSAIVALRQGRLHQAWEDFDAAARASPEVGEYRYGRGLAALRMGRINERRGDMDRARAVSEDGELTLWPEDLRNE